MSSPSHDTEAINTDLKTLKEYRAHNTILETLKQLVSILLIHSNFSRLLHGMLSCFFTVQMYIAVLILSLSLHKINLSIWYMYMNTLIQSLLRILQTYSWWNLSVSMKYKFAYFFFLSMVIILVILFVSRDSPFSVLFHFLKGFFPSTNKIYVTIDLLNIVNKNKHLPQLDKPWVSEHIYFLNPQLDMILWHPMKHTCIIKLYLPLHVHSYKIL